ERCLAARLFRKLVHLVVRLILFFFFRGFVLFRRLVLLGRFFLSRTFRLLSLFDLARPLVGLLLSLVGLLLLPLVGFALSLVDLRLFLVPLGLRLIIPRLAVIGLRRTLCIRAVLVHILF